MVLEKTLKEPLGQQGDQISEFLKETNPEYSLEGLLLELKLQYFGHLMQRSDSLEKTLMLGKGVKEDEMDQRLNGHEFEQTPGDDGGQGNLACCSPRGRRIGHN